MNISAAVINIAVIDAIRDILLIKKAITAIGATFPINADAISIPLIFAPSKSLKASIRSAMEEIITAIVEANFAARLADASSSI